MSKKEYGFNMINVCDQYLPSKSISNISDCINSGRISNGHYIGDFESQWSKYCDRKFGVAVNNGTSALELALRVLDLPKGSEVIMPSFTIISCAIAAIRNDLVPVFVDVDPETWCIDPYIVSQSITNKTRVIMPVHMYGYPADMTVINSIAQSNNLYVIEDAAQAHGAECVLDYNTGKWSKCGSIGHMSCFSFYNNKIITTGEGGMVLTNDSILNDKLLSYRNLCFGIGNDRFKHSGIGSNFRITNMQASLAGPQIDSIDDILLEKRNINALYRSCLNDRRITFQGVRSCSKSVFWMNAVMLDRPSGSVMSKLYDFGIETRPLFAGLHRQNIRHNSKCDDFSMTDNLSERGLYLPSGINLTDDQIKYVSETLIKILDN